MPKTLREYDPLAAVDEIERDATNDNTPYRRRVEKLMKITLSPKQVGSVDDAGDAALLRQTKAGHTLETAARMAGFALGFEHYRRMSAGKDGMLKDNA